MTPPSKPNPRTPHLALWLLPALVLVACQPSPQGQNPKPADAQATSTSSVPASDLRYVFSNVAAKSTGSVVSVTTEKTVPVNNLPFDLFGGDPFQFFFGQPGQHSKPQHPKEQREEGLGSGFFATSDGLVLTNHHVIDGAEKVQIVLADERSFPAEVVGADKPTDLAVLRIKDRSVKNLPPPLPIGDSDKLRLGEWVLAIGAPFGLRESVTAGIISAKGRSDTGLAAYGNFLQTDAAINPGNSGGPLLDLSGRVVGINTAILSRSGGSQGIGFAIPINLAKQVLDQLVKNGKVTRGWLGVSIQSLSPDLASALKLESTHGALVGDVLADGPAAKAGIKRGDVIVTLMGKPVRDANDLMNRVAMIAPGTVVKLGIVRAGKSLTLEATIAKRSESEAAKAGTTAPDHNQEPSIGATVANLNDDLRQRFDLGTSAPAKGVVVVDVDPDGNAADAGVRPGDVILEANGKPVASVEDFTRALSEVGKKGNVLLLLQRAGHTVFVVVKIQ